MYVWPVPERAGPGPGDPSSVMWMYHSHVDETKDVNTGLLGVIIIVKFSINGFTRGTMLLADVTIRKGQRVRWYVMSSTNDFDFHTPHWHGNVVMVDHMRTDVVSVAQMEMLVADMMPDNPGTWLFHCHVSFTMQREWRCATGYWNSATTTGSRCLACQLRGGLRMSSMR